MEIFIILLVLVLIIYLIVKVVNQKSRLEHMRKQMAQIEQKRRTMESEALKFQMQPHTLNNLLNNLKVISSRLNRGLERLSGVLDYILYGGESNQMTSPENEVDFIRKYLALNQDFLPHYDSIKFNSDDVMRTSPHYSRACIPHLVSAYFLENAFKHGDKNHADFLKITVQLSKDYFLIQVINRVPLNPRQSNPGIGHDNLKRRLSLLMGDRYSLSLLPDENQYKATLTLMLT
jgi:two-component system, LytTR family, sensor kinase